MVKKLKYLLTDYRQDRHRRCCLWVEVLGKGVWFLHGLGHYLGTHFLLGFPAVLESPVWFTAHSQHGQDRMRWEQCSHGICGEGTDAGSKHTVTAWPPPSPFPGYFKALSLDTFEQLLIIFAQGVINYKDWLIYYIKVAASDFPQSSCSAETPAQPQKGTCLWKAEHQQLLFQSYFSLLMTV